MCAVRVDGDVAELQLSASESGALACCRNGSLHRLNCETEGVPAMASQLNATMLEICDACTPAEEFAYSGRGSIVSDMYSPPALFDERILLLHIGPWKTGAG